MPLTLTQINIYYPPPIINCI